MNHKKEIIFFSKLAYERKYTVGGEGNISIRISDNRFLITPSGVLKPLLKPADLVEINAEGKIISGKRKPSSEYFSHLEIYRQNPQIKTIIHAHPFFTVLESSAKKSPFDKPFNAEAVLFLDKIRIFPYAAPASSDGAEVLKGKCSGLNILIIENHGSFTCGEHLSEAFSLLEMMEKCSAMYHYARSSGTKLRFLTRKEIDRLEEIKNG